MHVQAQRATRVVAQRIDVIDGLVDGIQDRLGIGQEALAGFGQRYTARRAIEKADAKPLLERANHFADARSRNSKLPRCFAEAALLCDRHEGAQLSKLSTPHRDIPQASNASTPHYQPSY